MNSTYFEHLAFFSFIGSALKGDWRWGLHIWNCRLCATSHLLVKACECLFALPFMFVWALRKNWKKCHVFCDVFWWDKMEMVYGLLDLSFLFVCVLILVIKLCSCVPVCVCVGVSVCVRLFKCYFLCYFLSLIWKIPGLILITFPFLSIPYPHTETHCGH